MATYREDHRLGKPVPAHALEAVSLEAVETVRRLGRERRLQQVVDRIVIDHGRLAPSRWQGDPLTRNALKLQALAEAAGFQARLHVLAEACMVEGHHPSKVGFQMWWIRGSVDGGSWHTPWEYALVEDARPVEIDKVARVGKVGARSPGVGTVRLSIVGSPRGVPLGYTALIERLSEYRDRA